MLWATLRQIRSDDPRKRVRAARKLAGNRDPRAIAALVGVLYDADIEVRRAAATSLGECGDPSAVDPLVAVVWDRCSFIQWEASGALARIGLPGVRRLAEGLELADAGLRAVTEQTL